MPVVSVVLPTVRGREDLLDQTRAAFERTTAAAGVDLELVIVRDRPTCGEAWNDGAQAATGDWLLLGADDLVPHDGWTAVLDDVDRGVWPAPWIVRVDGSTECCGTLGSGLLLDDRARDGLPVNNSPVPLMRRDTWPRVGPTIPAHCYSDDFLAWRARAAGLEVEVRRAFKFTHLDGQIGHARLVARSGADRQLFAEAVTRL
ncbi:MAG: glycosyltransferase [Steroidobacteraceae bacterium]|nr:glycosyltransferase [Steroidobacteraceae bacterium]